MILLPGVCAFILFLLFDVNKIRWHRTIINATFPAGVILLALSAALCIRRSTAGGVSLRFGVVIFLILSVFSLFLTVYALFFALPAKTYSDTGALSVVSSGLYGLCRHPACWPFAMIYVFLYLAFGGKWLLYAMLLYPALNLLYAAIQDRYIFPQYIRGYDDYRASVPFLIPRFRRK